MLDKYVWRVLFLALLATTSLALTSRGTSCHSESDVLQDERTRLRMRHLESGKVSSTLFANDTTYERLSCIGFNPDLSILSATIEVKLPFGFGGGLCTKGSFEYVRFWVNYGGGWTDIGVTVVNTHDIPDSLDCSKSPTKPLHYTLSLKFNPNHKLCTTPVLPRIRATLSWNEQPPNNPYFSPVWGNTLEETIESPPINIIPITTVVYTGTNSNSSNDLVGIPDSVSEGYSDGCTADQEVFSAKDVDVQLDAGVANVDFEELTCLGLDWGQSSLVATVRVKKTKGYSATPCQRNRFEYVSFWADWGDRCSWTFLGTTKFNVHDFANSPSTGLVYTAVMPVDVSQFSAPCNKTKIARVRAALAFDQIPPPPPAVAPRGNYIESHVHLQPYDGEINPMIPRIRLIGNVPIQQILTTPGFPNSGMTIDGALVVGHGYADPSGDNSRPCPFGGTINVRGDPVLGHSYRLMARPYPPVNPAYPGLPVMEPIGVYDLTIPAFITIFPSSEGYFDYLEPLKNYENLLSLWKPGPGTWQIRLEMAKYSTTTLKYEHEGYSPWYTIFVNAMNPPPYAYLDIAGTECNDIHINDEMFGKFVATSGYFDTWGFGVTPGGIPHTVTVDGSPNPLLPVPEPGKTWRLATTDAKACGYVIWLAVWDRTVVDSGSDRYHVNLPTGFCLRK